MVKLVEHKWMEQEVIWNRRVPVVNLLDRADDVENELEFEGSSDIAG